MIDLTRSKRFKVQNSEIDFKALISESLNSLRNLDGAHRVEVKTRIEDFFPFYNDPSQLSIIFNNLISNAIKFQHAHEMHPYLEISILVDAQKATMQFRDNGVGIAKENLGKVFDMFYRTPGSKADGAGLGLYIVKEIVRKLKGKILVDSTVNEGSKFVIELPNKIHPDLLRKFNKIIQDNQDNQ
jgi:signal transduction histidine kinase